MRRFFDELAPLLITQAAFVNWEAAKYRANDHAKVSFPESHPLRRVFAQTAKALENHRWSAELAVFAVAEKYGDFRVHAHGLVLNEPAEWFRPREILYFDQSGALFSKGSRRSKQILLAGLHSMHELEASGRCFINAVHKLVDRVRPKAKRDLVRTAKLFDKDCRRLAKELARVQVSMRDRMDVLLCLQRRGLPCVLGQSVLMYLA